MQEQLLVWKLVPPEHSVEFSSEKAANGAMGDGESDGNKVPGQVQTKGEMSSLAWRQKRKRPILWQRSGRL